MCGGRSSVPLILRALRWRQPARTPGTPTPRRPAPPAAPCSRPARRSACGSGSGGRWAARRGPMPRRTHTVTRTPGARRSSLSLTARRPGRHQFRESVGPSARTSPQALPRRRPGRRRMWRPRTPRPLTTSSRSSPSAPRCNRRRRRVQARTTRRAPTAGRTRTSPHCARRHPTPAARGARDLEPATTIPQFWGTSSLTSPCPRTHAGR
mmetsp:Transcript_16160/g.46206  ORF Transcript_16160/g.46206 Transcript_16160/m.46206 type:complete len:209 (-) Transcript_16160:420-1046(-)